jgi:hypothetical protein
VSAAGTTGSRIVACLTRISSLLEQGEVLEASKLMPELTELTSGEPEPMTEAELAEARRVLSCCGALERGLHESNLQALQRLGATRRSQAYVRAQEAPQTRR